MAATLTDPAQREESPPRRRRATRRADLLLGIRLALSGGRDGIVRALMTGIGVGLGVAMLLLATAVPGLMADRQHRGEARSVPMAAEAKKSDRTVLTSPVAGEYHGEPMNGEYLRADGANPPLPPGLTHFPKPGEMAVSPALDRLLDSPAGKLLRPRLNYRQTEVIGNAGLQGPNELYVYIGSDRLGGDSGERVASFGVPPDGSDNTPLDLIVLVVVAVAVLLVPIGVFIAAAARFGGESRDRRLAAIRLVGADRAQTRRIAAGESLAGAVLGLLIGGALFLAARQLAPNLSLMNMSVFSGSITPDPVLSVVVVVAVLALTVLVSLVAMRRVSVEPLGVVRSAGTAKRRLWWRVVMPVVGLAAIALGLRFSSESLGQVVTAAGIVLLLVGVALVLPWVVDRSVRRLGGGSVSWTLAVRRLQLGGDGATRLVNGIAVAVAGAIALQMLFVSADSRYTTREQPRTTQATASYIPRPHEKITADQVRARFAGIPGVRAGATTVYDLDRPDKDATSASLNVGDCAALRELADIGSCRDGDIFTTSDEVGAHTGEKLHLGGASGRGRTWTVPAGLKHTTSTESGGLFATPKAAPHFTGGSPTFNISLRYDERNPDTIERIRNAAAVWGPDGYVGQNMPTQTKGTYRSIRTGILVAVVLMLALIAAGMFVTTAEQLRERKRMLSVLTAFGTRRSVLARSVLWQTAVPTAVATVLAVAVGLLLGGVVLRLEGEPLVVPWADVGRMAALGAAVVLVVTAASTPLLMKLTRPDGLRSE